MVVRSWKSATSLVLALNLLGASLAPPGIRHSHPIAKGGAVHHGHEAESLLSDQHDHHGASWSDHQADQDSDVAQLGETRRHVHIHLLGWDITLPDPVSSQDDDRPQDVVEWVTLAGGEQPLPGHTVSLDSFQQHHVPSAVLSVSDAALIEAKASPPPPVSFAPLCDSARRERSGVLRA